MRRFVVLVAIALVLGATSAFGVNREKQAYLLDQVLRLSHEGVPDRLILKQIESMDFVFELTADDIVELRTLGVSDDVIEALIDTQLREGERNRDVYVRVSAGYYSPWYQFPYAWGFYYDPFPDWYSYYYYPFHYRDHHFGWYGWCGNSYYYSYNWYDQPYRHHDRDYRRHRSRDHRDGDPIYRVAQQVPADVAQVPVRPVTQMPAGSGVAAPRQRVRENGPEPQTRTIATRVARPSLQSPRTPFRAERVGTPPTRGQSDQRRSGRDLDAMRAPFSAPDVPAATRAEPTAREAETAQPVSRARESRGPTLQDRRSTSVETRPAREASAPERAQAPERATAPERASRPSGSWGSRSHANPPAAPAVRAPSSSGAWGSRSSAVPSHPAGSPPSGISRGKVR